MQEDLLIAKYYDHTGYLGIARTLAQIAAKHWFLHMAKKVKTYGQQCDTGERTKVNNTKVNALLKPI